MLLTFEAGTLTFFPTLIQNKVIFNEGGKSLAPAMWVMTKTMTLLRFEKEN